MSMNRRYVMGMLSGAGSVVLRSALNVLVVPVLIAKLGLDVFGLYIVLLAILEVATFLDLGATSAIVTQLSGEHEEKERRSILKVAHVWFGVLALLFLIVSVLGRGQFCPLFHIAPALQTVVLTSFVFMAIESTLAIYSCYCRSVLLAHCAHQWTNIADSVSNLCVTVGSLMILLSGGGLIEIMMLRLAAALFRLGLMTFQTIRMEPFALRPQVPFNLMSLWEMARLTGHSMMINVSIIISHKMDDLVIAHFLPLSAVGIYEIVFRFLGITVQIGLKLCEGIYPVFAKLATSRQVSEARQIFLRKSAFLNIVSTLILVIIVSFYPELFALFSAGKIPIQNTLPVLAVALPCVWSGVLQMPANAWLFTWGHQRFVSVTSFSAALVNLALSVILVQHWGIVGVAIGTLVPQLIQHQLGLIRKSCQELGIGTLEYIGAVHGKAIVPLLATGLFILLCRPILPHALFLLPTIGIIAMIAGLLGAFLWFQFSATSQEKEMLYPLLKKVLPFKLSLPIQRQNPRFSPNTEPDQAS